MIAPMPAASTFYPRVFALVGGRRPGLCAAVLIFTPFFAAMSWAAFLAFLLYPLNLRLRRRLRGNGRAAGLLTVLDAHRHPAAVERAVDRVRGADFHPVAAGCSSRRASLDIKSLSDLQQFPVDRARQRLAAGAQRNLRRARSSRG